MRTLFGVLTGTAQRFMVRLLRAFNSAVMEEELECWDLGDVCFLGSNNKDYSILVSTLGSPYLGKLPYHDPIAA